MYDKYLHPEKKNLVVCLCCHEDVPRYDSSTTKMVKHLKDRHAKFYKVLGLDGEYANGVCVCVGGSGQVRKSGP